MAKYVKANYRHVGQIEKIFLIYPHYVPLLLHVIYYNILHGVIMKLALFSNYMKIAM